MAVASTVIALQFGIMSPEDIRRGSVVEIDSRDTYINNKPVIAAPRGADVADARPKQGARSAPPRR